MSRLPKQKSTSLSSGVASKQGSRERNLPIPLLLFTSYIAAEKSDKLIKVFCKELPGILKKIEESKKALENKTKSVYKLKEDIMIDLKKLELANIVLKELYKEEEQSKLNKDKEIQLIHSQISSCEHSKKMLSNSLIHYSQSKEVLDSLAVESSQYNSAGSLIHSYLTLQAMNEMFIADECEYSTQSESNEKEDFELQKLLLKHKYDVMIREKHLENLLNKCQILKNINYKFTDSMDDILHCRKQELLTRLQIKRWAYDVCLKIGVYKENTLHTEDFLKLLNEILEFIVFARNIILKLEEANN